MTARIACFNRVALFTMIAMVYTSAFAEVPNHASGRIAGKLIKALDVQHQSGFILKPFQISPNHLWTDSIQKYSFSLQQCVDYAAANNIQVKKALVDIQKQFQVNREVTALALPNVSGSIEATYFPRVPIQRFPNFIAAATYGVLEQEGVRDGNGNQIVSPNDFGFVEAQFGTSYTSTVGVSFSQILFDGQVFIGLQARSSTMELARKTKEVTEEMIRVNVHKLYYQLVIGKKQLELLDANIERIKKLLTDTEEIYKNGFAEKLDVNKVKVSLANLETEKNRLENQLKAGNLGLKFLIGMPVANDLELTDDLSDDMIKDGVLNDAYNYADRRDYQLTEIGRKLNEYNIRRYKLSYIPTIALFGTYSRNAQRNEFNFFKAGEPWFTTALVGLKISVPIFDGFAKDAKMKQARADLDKSKLDLDYLKQSIDHDVAQAKISIRNAILAMDVQKENMRLAEEVYQQTKLKYEQGLGSNLEITNAQTELKQAQTNYFTALYDAVIARIDYLKAMGKL